MKYWLFNFLIIFILSLDGYSQNSFSILYSTQSEEFSGGVTEHLGHFFFALNKVNNQNALSSYLYKINFEGDTALSVQFHSDAYKFEIQQLIGIGSQLMVVASLNQTLGDCARLCVLILNDNLSILNENIFELPFFGFYMRQNIRLNTGECLLGGICFNEYGGSDQDVFLIKLSTSGDTLKTKRFECEGSNLSCDLVQKNQSDNILLLTDFMPVSFFPEKHVIIELTSDLDVVKKDAIPGGVLSNTYYNCLTRGGIGYFFTSKLFIPASNGGSAINENDILLMKTDDFYQVIDSIRLGALDTVDYPAGLQHLGFSGDGNLYVAGTKNFDNYNAYSCQQSWLSLFKIDTALNILWKKYYCGTPYWILYDFLPTTDGGCVFVAWYYNSGHPDNLHDVVFFKLNSDGLLTSTPENPTLRPHHAIVYPNPGHGALKVEAGPQIFGATFELFDMGGQRVVQQTIQTSVTAINTTLLPSGAYPWRIIWKGEVVEEGKWVKD